MKIFALLFLVGFASASSFYDVLDDAAEEIYHDFMLGMEEAPSLKEYLGVDDDQLLADENDIKTELGKKLRETLDHLLEKIKDAVDHGKTIKEDLQQKLKEIKEKMKDLHIEVGEKARELIERIKEKSKEFLKNLLEKLGLKDKRALFAEEAELALLDFNIKDIFQRLKKALLDKIDKEKLKAKIEEFFGKGSKMGDSLLEIINEKGDKYKQKLLDLIDRFLGQKEKRSVSDYWEKIKDYFKDLHIDLKEKYSKFGEWVKNVITKGLDKSKSKIENIREIAREFIDHAKGVSKEVAVEAENFLRPYKDDLGKLYDQVKETVKEIIKNRG